jgi:hypothetical protein
MSKQVNRRETIITQILSLNFIYLTIHPVSEADGRNLTIKTKVKLDTV